MYITTPNKANYTYREIVEQKGHISVKHVLLYLNESSSEANIYQELIINSDDGNLINPMHCEFTKLLEGKMPT